MKFFVTGFSGFIAKHLAKRLIEDGHDVDTIINSKRVGGTEEWMLNERLRIVDSCKIETGKYDYVIHLAATTSIKTDAATFIDVAYNNIIFAQKVMSTPFRTIYASSTSVYELNNPYAYSKAFNEHLGNLHGNALGLRFFNCYGAGNNKGIVKRVIDCCLSGETLTLQGGDQIRDFIYIDDVVDIIIGHLDNPLQVMDVGTGVGTKIYDVVKIICHTYMQIIGKEGKPFRIEWKNSDYGGEQMESIAHSHPVKEYIPLREGIRKTIEETLKLIK